jgi:DNA repair exonuclease SbcCD ATPase subunit
MILKKCYIENFGRLHKFSYDFQKGLNIIKQENGWGKTTLSVFIKSMFFGLPANRKSDLSQNQRKKYAPWQGGNFGGYIEFEMGGKAYRIERFFGKTESQDTFALYDLTTNKPSNDYSSMIGYEIFKLDEDAYERSTFFPQSAYKTGINDSIRAKLTNLIEDEDDIAGFSQAIESLKFKKSMFEKRGNKGIVAELEDKQIDLQEQLQECLNRQEQNTALRKRLNQLEQEEHSLKTQADGLSQKIDQIKENRVYKEILETYTRYKIDFDRANALYESMRLEFRNRPVEQDEVDSLHKKVAEVNQAKLALREYEQKISSDALAQTKPNSLGLLIMIISALVAAGGIGALFFNLILGSVLIGSGLIGLIAGFFELKNFKKQDDSLLTIRAQIKTMSSKVQNDLNYITNSLKSYYGDVNEYNYYEVYNDFKYNAKLLHEKRQDMENKRQVLLDYMEEKQLDDQKIERYASLQYDYSLEQDELNIVNQKSDVVRAKIFDLKTQINQNQAYVVKIEELKSELDIIGQNLKEARYYNETLKLAMDYLTKARETLTRNYLDKMEKSCSKYMSRFETKDSFSIDTDLAVMIEKSGEKKELDYFSEGYKDIVGLCTRLALVDVMFEREKPFLILDDPFVNLDDQNLERAKNIINEIAKNYQVIYLICHTSRARII